MVVRRSVVLAIVFLLATGCVSRRTLERVQAQLDECREDKQAAQEASSACEQRYAQEVQQWKSVQGVVEETLPRAIQDFREERERIIQLIPEQVRGEVESYLEDFSVAVSRGFEVLKQDNERILTELSTAQQRLDEVGDRTRSIDETVGSTLQSTMESRNELQKRIRTQSAAIAKAIHDFDRSYINDRQSENRLRLNRKERETLVLFHDRLVGMLTALGQAPEGSSAGDQAPGGG